MNERQMIFKLIFISKNGTTKNMALYRHESQNFKMVFFTATQHKPSKTALPRYRHYL